MYINPQVTKVVDAYPLPFLVENFFWKKR